MRHHTNIQQTQTEWYTYNYMCSARVYVYIQIYLATFGIYSLLLQRFCKPIAVIICGHSVCG